MIHDDRIVYAINDFGLSMVLPSGIDRLDARQSWVMFAQQPFDTMQGELDYDAFAYDIGALGALFCEKFQVCDLAARLICLIPLSR